MKADYYLAHPLDFREWTRKWELDFENRTGIVLINPFYDVDREDVKNIDSGRFERYKQVDYQQLVLRDLEHIQNTRIGTIGLIPPNTHIIGTYMEMVYTRMMNKKLYLLVTDGHENHPWLKFHANKIFTDLSDLEKFLINKRPKLIK